MKKILVIRFSSIGDIVLTTPVLRCLKLQANAEVHYLTKKPFAGILESNPYVSRIYSIEKDIREVAPRLKAENYDLVIDLHHNLRSAAVKLKLGKPSRSFRKLNVKKWLAVNLKADVLPRLHIVDRYLETIKDLGVVNDGKGLDHFIPEKDNVPLSELPESHRGGYTGFVIGAKHFTKQLPAEKIISICKKLGSPVALLGGKEDFEKGELIRKAMGANIFNACGKFSLHQSASLIRQASRIITHDTGLMHIAAAFQKDIISVWGNTIPEFGMYPYLGTKGNVRSTMAEVKGLSCRPCSKIGYSKCPKGHFKCMMEIDENIFVK